MAGKHLNVVGATERAAHLVALFLEREIAPLGVTQAEAHVLARLDEAGPTSPNELHRLFGHKRSTLTSVIDRLEARGYVERAINASDRRSFIVSLTPVGETAAATVGKAVFKLERRIASRLTRRDLIGFCATVDAMQAEIAVAAKKSAA